MKKEIFTGNSLAHTKWNCKYHIVFAPKYRRKVFFEDKRQEITKILNLTELEIYENKKKAETYTKMVKLMLKYFFKDTKNFL